MRHHRPFHPPPPSPKHKASTIQEDSPFHGTNLPHYYLVASHHLPDCSIFVCLPSGPLPKTLTYRAAHSQDQSPPPSDYELAYECPPPSALKLEELSLGVLNKLSPGNLKKATDEFMKEWEKSLIEPAKDKAC